MKGALLAVAIVSAFSIYGPAVHSSGSADGIEGTAYRVATDGSGDFRSIAEVNAADLAAGDVVRLARGDIFAGVGLRARPGVTYEAYGAGAKPVITRVAGIAARVRADGVTLRDLKITEVTGPGVRIDDASGVRIEGLELDRVALDGERASLTIFNSRDITIRDSVFARSEGSNHIWTWNTQGIHIEGNAITWHGPQDGDGIQLSRSDDFYIGHNQVTSLGGGKGGIILTPDNTVQPTGGVIEHNDVTGGQFGISPRQDNTLVQNNIVRDVGNQAHSQDWASGIWVSGGFTDADLDVSGLVIRDNVLDNNRNAFGGWDTHDGLTTEYQVHNNVIRDADDQYFGNGNGIIKGRFYKNIIVNSAGRRVGAYERSWIEEDNYFYRVDYRRNCGGDPLLDEDFRPTNGEAAGFGLSDGALVGPQHGVFNGFSVGAAAANGHK